MPDGEYYPSGQRNWLILGHDQTRELIFGTDAAYSQIADGIQQLRKIMMAAQNGCKKETDKEILCQLSKELTDLEGSLSQIVSRQSIVLEELDRYNDAMNCVYAPPEYFEIKRRINQSKGEE